MTEYLIQIETTISQGSRVESGDECLEELPRECVLCLHAVSCAFPLVLLEANDSLLLALYAMHVIMLFSQNNWLLSCVPVGFLSHDDLLVWRSHYV